MKKAVLYADGASSGNPGHSGIGIVLTIGEKTYEVSEYIGVATNNVAEYSALIRGLEKAKSLHVEGVEVFLDSELLVKQMSGVYRVKSENLRSLWQKARRLSESFESLSISHIPRELNKEADRLAKKGCDPRRLKGASPQKA